MDHFSLLIVSPYANLDERQAKDCLFHVASPIVFDNMRISAFDIPLFLNGLFIPKQPLPAIQDENLRHHPG
jgi:hypothetical protein